MHPAYSVILFTTASGAGYGLLFWLGLAAVVDALPGGAGLALSALALALVLITAGLLSSTLHLGHPERAMGAFSQWRSSWLSREGVAAVATYIPAGLLGLFWIFGSTGGGVAVLGLLAAAGAVATVYCTGMIYASLRTVRHWHQPTVPVVYLLLAGASGALLFGAVLAAFGHHSLWLGLLVLVFLLAAGAVKRHYWGAVDADPGTYTAEMALGMPGPVRQLDPPHTRPNFVMREMGYQVGRKHAVKLRRASVLTLVLVPALCVVLALVLPALSVLYFAALISAGIGLILERWLFFAEAEHVSQLYYGQARA